MRVTKIAVALVLIAYSAVSAESSNISPRLFVQEFYKWYELRQSNSKKESSWISAIREKRVLFSADLKTALENDAKFSNNSNGDINSLDFDPFLNTQDPDKFYKVGRVSRRRNKVFVNVCSNYCNDNHNSPDVIVVLIYENKNLVFSDFYYPDHRAGLKSILRKLSVSR